MKENYNVFLSGLRTLLRPQRNYMETTQLSKKQAMPTLKHFVVLLAVLVSVNGWSKESYVAVTTAKSDFFQTTAPVIVGASNITQTSAVLKWNAVTDGTTPTYTVEVYTTAALTAPAAFTSPVLTATTTSWAATGLTDATTYYFVVKAGTTTSTTASFTTGKVITPLEITAASFTADVIANGTGLPSASTTGSVDTANFAYIAMDYRPSAASPLPVANSALPINRVLTSPTAGVTYQVQNYTGNNSVKILNMNDVGTVTLATPVKASVIYFAVTSGNGAAILAPTVTFSDGTTQTAAAITLVNWDAAVSSTTLQGIPNAMTMGRVDRSATTVAAALAPTATGAFKVFEMQVAILPANQNKLISSIAFVKTNATGTGVAQIFGATAVPVPACPVIASTSAASLSTTSGTISWVPGSFGDGATSVTYTLEVYTDTAFTTPFTGSPFTGITATSQTVTGLTFGTPYYYRVKANNGTCDSPYVTGSLTLAYCVPTRTSTSTSYIVTNFTTTGAYTNINNTSVGDAYTNYSSQIVTKIAGSSFNFNGVKGLAQTYSVVDVWVDWNGDLDFDDAGEFIVTAAPAATAFSGTITIPANQPNGNYRLRIRSRYTFGNASPSPCGSQTYSDVEDYTLAVITAPANCATPDVPVLTLASTTAGVTSTITPATTPPTGYLVVRSTSATLTAQPVFGTSYAVDSALGGGTVALFTTTPANFTDNPGQNTKYYYFVYAYNNGGATCLGPVYSTAAATANLITCTAQAQLAATSNIKSTNATINWSTLATATGNPVTYNVDVATDAAFTNKIASFTNVTTTSQDVTGLVNATVYYIRVNGVTATGCSNQTYSTGSFTAVNNFTPISIVAADYNADVIANGYGLATASTNADIDLGGYSYTSRDYKNNSTASYAFGLPINRTLTSTATATPGLTYLMADYSVNNSLRITGLNEAGTMHFVTPVKLSSIYISATGGSGASSITATVLFQDGTSLLVNNPLITIPDWFTAAGTPIILANIGRVLKTNVGQNAQTDASQIYQVTIPLDLAYQGKFVTGITFTKVTSGNVVNIFGISGRVVGSCPTIGTITANIASSTSVKLDYNIISAGEGSAATSYVVEAFSDAAMTVPVTGSPFAATTATTLTVTGLTTGSTYYFRVKAYNGVCYSDYSATASKTLVYCSPAPSSVDNNGITNVTIGTINNTTGKETNNYGDFTAMAATSWASAVVPFAITFDTGFTYDTKIWIDWNKDLDFDDAGEEVYVGMSTNARPTVLSGTFTVPAGTALGSYRMRIGGVDVGPPTPCWTSSYGSFEDYTLNIITAPAPCTAPNAPTIAVSGVTASAITTTVTAPATAPTGYLVIRSTAATLTAQPVVATNYAVGATVGGGTVIAVGTTAPATTQFLPANTQYYYFAYAYNDGGATCLGPVYSTAVTVNATTCANATVAVGATNITNSTATLNWTSIAGSGGAAVTYTVEVYKDAALTNLVGSYTSSTNTYDLTGLTNGSTYYFRVKGSTTGCSDATWSSTVSFIARNSYTAFNLTGFNADVIANGNGIANLSTTAAVDAVNNAYLSVDYKNTATAAAAAFGLPLNRLLQGTELGLNLMFEDYSLNNSLRLPAQNQVGELTLAKPARVSDLYFAVTSGSGDATISAEVQFTDNTTQPATTFTTINWDSAATDASPYLATAIGRVNRADATGAPEGPGAFKVFQLSLPILAANQTKTVKSVKFTKTSTGTTEPVPHVFAISGKVINPCPVLANATTAVATSTGATISWTLNSGTADSYTVEVYTDAARTIPAPGSPFAAGTASPFTVTGLATSTTYYYSVKATNSVCTSNVPVGTFTTVCPVIDTPTADAQTLCANSTIANLAVNGTGTTPAFNWYADATTTTKLDTTTVLASGTYYVTQTVSNCESSRLAVIVTITPLPATPVVDDAKTVCSDAIIADLTATGDNGSTIKWYTTAALTEPALSSDFVLVAGTYYVTQTVGACTSLAAQTVVTVNPKPAAPVADALQTYCAGSTVADLAVDVADGATFSWYTTESGTPLAATDVIAAGSYYVTQTVNGCTSLPTTITVEITTITPPVVANQTFCDVANIADLQKTVIDGATVNWFGQDGESIADTASLTSGTYTVSQTVGDCTSLVTTFTVTITPTPDAPTGTATQDFVEGDTLADFDVTTATGATVQWYTKATDGTYTAVPGTTVAEDGVTYYVTQTNGTCESATFAVTAHKVLGTDQFTFKHLTVYPNPVADVLTIANTSAITKVVVINLIGQTVFERKANDTTVQINTQALQAGPYILQVYSADNFATVKFIKK